MPIKHFIFHTFQEYQKIYINKDDNRLEKRSTITYTGNRALTNVK